jgi:GMP synthase-like glutamine amidotransferase
MPWADSIVLKTKDGPMIQVNDIAWSRNVEAGALPFMRITETHGDSVVTLPADAQVLAVSDSSTNELFLVGRNILAFQSHPEFTWENQL